MPQRQQSQIVVKESSSCWQRRTLLEKLLIALCFLATIAILALSLSLYLLNARGEHDQTKLVKAEPLRKEPVQTVYAETVAGSSNVKLINSENDDHRVPIVGEELPNPVPCQTPGCVLAASKMLSYLDENLDPCENFYSFACGSYLKVTQVPEDKVTVNAFSNVRKLVQEQLRDILNEPPGPQDSKPFLLAKNFHASCLNQPLIEERGIKPLADILESFGGWPVLKGYGWSEGSFDWVETIKKFRRMGFDTYIIFAFNAETNLKNSSERILVIDQGSHELGREYLIKGIEDEAVKAYHKFMVDNVVLFAGDKSIAEDEMKDALEFEIKLAEIALPQEERRNASALYHLFTIKQLQESYPYLNWLDYINAMMPFGFEVYENETIVNTVPSFFEKLGDVLNSTPKRTIANYLLWRAVLTTSGSLTADLLKPKLEFYKTVYGLQSQQPRETECIQLTSDQLPISVGALYVRKFFDETKRQSAIDLVENIRGKFVDFLGVLQWMDEQTRNEAIKKAKAITTHIGYPNELADNNKLEEYYQNLEIDPDNLLLNSLRLTAFYFDRNLNKLREPVNKTDWEDHATPTTVGATYRAKENAINFPAAILQDRFFSADRPHYQNYASIGSVIGHEITHGFDDKGRQFDADGNLHDWWDTEAQKQFLEKANCTIEQYGNYTDLKANLPLNGINTQGENIAGNGGTKEAYYAYADWVKRNGPEGVLPGLRYNQQQLFWISFANLRCSVSRDYYIKNQILTGVHAPNEFRINGVVANLPEFAYDFNCPVGTKMNPQEKCAVWHPLCCHDKSSCEKVINSKLLALLLLLFIGVVTPQVQTGYVQYERKSNSITKHGHAPDTKCFTEGCLRTAGNIKSYLDESISPCQNFYSFACGNYEKIKNIPKDQGTINIFTEVEDLVSEQLRPIISGPSQPNELKAIQLAKYFYASCVNQEVSTEKRAIRRMIDILEELRGWPVVKGDTWQPSNFDWIKTIKKFRQLGLNTKSIFTLNVEVDSKNSSRRVLIIDQTQHELEPEFLTQETDDRSLKMYYSSMVAFARIWGANEDRAKWEMREALEFEIKLIKISKSREERRNDSALYNTYTIEQFQASYPYLNWLDYINAFLPADIVASANETVINFVPEFFDQLDDTLRTTSTRAIANYLLWCAVLTMSMALNEQRKYHFRPSTLPRWKECIQLTSEKFAIPLGTLYVRSYFKAETSEAATDLVKNIQNQFIDMIQAVSWMDAETRERAIKKAQALKIYIGYQDELEDWLLSLEDEYRELEIDPNNFLSNILRIEVFENDYIFGLLREPIQKNESDILLNPANVNAHYAFTEHAILFPAAVLQDRLFSTDKPNFVNYASVGSLIGHEITHGFDDQGRQYDFDGNLIDWWDPQTKAQFLEKAKCFIHQYGNYFDTRTNLTINGITSQGENIADNGGVKAAYFAYKKWIEQNGAERGLPGLNYDQLQLFWISYGQLWCSNSKDYVIRNQIIGGVHSLNEFRVNGPISNMPKHTFAHDFGCAVGTKMNPDFKCTVW